MTVSELIEKLKEMPQDMKVYCIDQYCCGCSAVLLEECYLTIHDNELVIGGD